MGVVNWIMSTNGPWKDFLFDSKEIAIKTTSIELSEHAPHREPWDEIWDGHPTFTGTDAIGLLKSAPPFPHFPHIQEEKWKLEAIASFTFTHPFTFPTLTSDPHGHASLSAMQTSSKIKGIRYEKGKYKIK